MTSPAFCWTPLERMRRPLAMRLEIADSIQERWAQPGRLPSAANRASAMSCVVWHPRPTQRAFRPPCSPTSGPRARRCPISAEVDRRIEFETTFAVVNADQFTTLVLDHPELTAATRRMIGYWFWELVYVTERNALRVHSVDEIWAGSQFVVDAFAAVVPVPVRHVPIPVARPATSGRSRSSFAPLDGLDDRFVFGVVLDHFSVTERKNPIGAIDAFRRAFAPNEGPVLVIKSMNGDKRWPHHQQVVAAADGRRDIVVWDEHLLRADHMAFIAAIDAFVSLHRSEGLGLHLAEAMWLETPTTRRGTRETSTSWTTNVRLLVDATLIPVTGGEGVYPAKAVWADPDVDLAASAMRRLVADAELSVRLSAAGRSRMEGRPRSSTPVD